MELLWDQTEGFVALNLNFFTKIKNYHHAFFFNVINGILFMCAGPLVLTVVLAICVHLCLPAPNWLTLRPV